MPGWPGWIRLWTTARHIAIPGYLGVTHGNPIWEEVMKWPTRSTTFLLNVTLNRDKQITGVFAATWKPPTPAASNWPGRRHGSVKQAFDIVVTSNSGYPLDLNLYQSSKG